MREFITAAKAVDPVDGVDDGAVEFPVVETNPAGEEVRRVLCRAYRPSDGQLAVLMATTGRHSNSQEKIAGLINFFNSTLDDDSSNYVINRLLDRRDPFGIEQVQDIMEALIEEWSGRPTRSPSGSTPSPQSTGPSSTPTTPALT